MASLNNSHMSVVEPIRFHQVHGDNVSLSENNTCATRDRFTNTLLFTNRPVLSNEIVQFTIEETTTGYQGSIRFGLTSTDPDSFSRETLPKSIPITLTREWLFTTQRRPDGIEKMKKIRFKYTAEGDIYIDYDGTNFVKQTTISPITKDVWCTVDLNSDVTRIRLVQTESRVLINPVDRARARYIQYINNRQHQNYSTYYSDELSSALMTMQDCDENCELLDSIAVRKSSVASVTIDENLKRSMCLIMQILDMDHTLSTYLTIRCLTDGNPSNGLTKLIDTSFDHLVLGNEIGIRVAPDGLITFSCDNRCIRPLFNIDLTVNDNPQVQPTSYRLEFLMNGRVTALRLVGVYRPTAAEQTPPPVLSGGCQATVLNRICPNRLSGLLLPCRHLCVCYECGQALVDRHPCPNIKCRKPVKGCVKVFKD